MASSLPDQPVIGPAARSMRVACSAGSSPRTPRRSPSSSGTTRGRRLALAPDAAPSRFALHDAQLTVARRYGFTGWPALVHYLEVAAELSVDPSAVDEDALDPAELFCALSALRYDGTDAPPRRQAAAAMLAADPALVDRHVWAAAAASDPGVAATAPGRRSDARAARGWAVRLGAAAVPEPTPGRRSTGLRTRCSTPQRLLLDAGADPNAGYLWCGMSTPFTALTGVFGEGEQGPQRQPRHPLATGAGHPAARTRGSPGGPADALQPDVPARRRAPGTAVRPWAGDASTPARGTGGSARRWKPPSRCGRARSTGRPNTVTPTGWRCSADTGWTCRGSTVVEQTLPADPNELDDDGRHRTARSGLGWGSGPDPPAARRRSGPVDHRPPVRHDPARMGRTRLPDRGRRAAAAVHALTDSGFGASVPRASGEAWNWDCAAGC